MCKLESYNMNKEEFLNKAREVASLDTSADPQHWTMDNPLWGHCAVVSLLAQEVFGGDLIKGSLKDNPKYAYLRSHIWNRINGLDEDFTQEQYSDLSHKDLLGEVRSRDSIYNHPDTIRRYKLLKDRFDKN